MLSTDCRSNLCVPTDAGMFGGPQDMCRDACRYADECTQGGRNAGVCEDIQPFPMSNDLAAVCVPVQLGGMPRGDAGNGAACQVASDCARGYCANGRCLSTCSVDLTGSVSECAVGERCRPQALQLVAGGPTYSVLSCGP